MDTSIKTPQLAFESHQRLVVPLFQRPYVWNRDLQWEPLWNDLTRLAMHVLREEPLTHFIGAVVIQESNQRYGELPIWTIIDGQQRLTTLQLLIDAVRMEVADVSPKSAAKLLNLVRNGDAYIEEPEDRFKVWPTNRDRAMFAHLLGGDAAPSETDGARLQEAHGFFRTEARAWVDPTSSGAVDRATALETALRAHFQMVIIQLGADDDAQEIFETLNARGTQLTASDLVKNFVFSRLNDEGAPVEKAYEDHWKRFENGFWETPISVGRTTTVRSSLFLNHWLVARTGTEVVGREIFQTFKRFTTGHDAPPMFQTLQRLDRSAATFEEFTRSAERTESNIDRVALFAYRLTQLDIEAFRPVVLALLDPDLEPVPQDQLHKAVAVLESFLVRRALLRATTANYNRMAPELCAFVSGFDRWRAGDSLQERLAGESADATYWPGDQQIIDRLITEPLYHRFAGKRIRMLLEAVEDDLRGWADGGKPTAAQRAPRGTLSIEHLMPRKWRANWDAPRGDGAAERRDRLVHHLGNLTLLTKRLNVKASNHAWLGSDDAQGKRDRILRQETLLLNGDVLEQPRWDEGAIEARSLELAHRIVRIWPVPEGHNPQVLGRMSPTAGIAVTMLDLLAAGLLTPGQVLHAGPSKHRGRTAVVLGDGRIDVDGEVHDTPSGAAKVVAGNVQNGWWFWRTEPGTNRTLRKVRRQYAADAQAADDDAEANLDDEDDENDAAEDDE